MKKVLVPFFIVISLVLLICFFSSVYVVDEINQVVITRFGDPIGVAIKSPGIHFKLPFVDRANYFEKRLLAWDGDPNKVPTQDKKYLWIDSTARWLIVDPLKFLQTVHDTRSALSRLDDILDGATRNVIAKHNLIEIVRDSNRILSLVTSDEDKIMGRKFEAINEKAGRHVITSEMLMRAKPQLKEFGIELVDLRLKRINYDQNVREKVFQRMISERQRAAELLRAEGQGARAEIEGKATRELNKIQSEGYKKAQFIRGKADAQVTKIYAEAYLKDPEFYSFLNTLKSYETTLDNKTLLVLSTEGDYLKYLKDISAD